MRNTIDFFKLDDGLLGAINFNNMIPVKEENYEIIYLNKEKDLKEEKEYQTLLKKQLMWLNGNDVVVRGKAITLYRNIYDRCCNFPLLEEKCDSYDKEIILI